MGEDLDDLDMRQLRGLEQDIEESLNTVRGRKVIVLSIPQSRRVSCLIFLLVRPFIWFTHVSPLQACKTFIFVLFLVTGEADFQPDGNLQEEGMETSA